MTLRRRMAITPSVELGRTAQERTLANIGGSEVDAPPKAQGTATHTELAERDVSQLQLMAEAENADAQNELGTRYETGRGGVEQNTYKAREWYKRATEQKHADAQYRLGVMYTSGEWTSKLGHRKAFQLFLNAAGQGHPAAQYEVGVSFETGRGADQNKAESARWYRRAAEQGHRGALNKMVEVERLETQLHRMAEEGDPVAQYEVAMRYRNSESEEKQAEAVTWFRRAAEHGDARSEYMLGFTYDEASRSTNFKENPDPVAATEAARWYRRAAEQGYARAQAALGELYADGLGVARDHAEAVRWFRRAAEQGNAEGECLLGLAYREGAGVARDDAEAVRWLRRAADQGHREAQYIVCEMCKDGRWADAEAVKWVRWQGDWEQNDDALYALGIMYRQGWGVRRSNATAFALFQKAAKRGHYEAKAELADRPSLPRRVLERVESVIGLGLIIGLCIAFSFGVNFGLGLLRSTALDLLPPVWSAVLECPDHIERLADYGFRWTDSLWELKLDLSETVMANDADRVTYVGDKIEYQNTYGVWEPHVYACDVDIITREVVDVRAIAGRLPL